MTKTDRLFAEKDFHDRQAERRAQTYQARPQELVFDDDVYLEHETWIRPAFEQLGPLESLHVLDIGCGHGMAAIVMARRGARVTALDLSFGYLDEAQLRAKANGVVLNLIQANAEMLPFAAGSFDRIWGNAVLHHLDIDLMARELFRVLKPGGMAVFCEPWGENPMLNWVRNQAIYPGKDRTRDEQPLRQEHVDILRRYFPDLEVQGYQLLGMVRRLAPGRFTDKLNWCDQMILSRVPRLQRFCRYVVLVLER